MFFNVGKRLMVARLRYALTPVLSAMPMILGLAGSILAPGRVGAQEQSLLIDAGFAAKESVRPDEQIEFALSRSLKSDERIAVLIGTTDVSSVFKQDQLRLRYSAKLWPLPLGETSITVYLVTSNNEWKAVARFKLRVGSQLNESSLT